MRRLAAGIPVLLGVQLALVGVWWGVERARERDGERPAATEFEAVTGPAPALTFTRRDGSTGTLPERDGDVVVHFWATWCPPCREELPGLLSWADRTGTTVVAASVDPDWPRVEHFLGGAAPDAVVLTGPDTARAWGAESLPMTFVVEDGQITHVAPGAVDWEAHDPTVPWR